MFSSFGENISGIANSCTYNKREYGYIVCGIEDKTLIEKGVKFDPFNLRNGNQDLEIYLRSKIPEDQIVEGKSRKHQNKFSITSIREFLANMLIHQDFLDSSNPTIEIYPDRIEFVNIGTCLVDVNRIMDAVPKTRNPKLVDIMRRLRFCEKQGSGIDRAVQEIERMTLPAPSFENKPNGFIATLYAQKPFDAYTEREKVEACYLHVCLEYIWQKENNYKLATNQTIRERFNLPQEKYTAISNLVKKCIEKGLIRKFDPDNKAPRYEKYVPNWA